jgi:hypothetical protein
MVTALEQGKIKRTDTGITMVNWDGSDANKLLHNTNQIVRAKLAGVRPTVAQYTRVGQTLSQATNFPDFIDNIKAANNEGLPNDVNWFIVGYTGVTEAIKSTSATVYTKTPFSGNLTVFKSFNGVNYTAVGGVSVSTSFDGANNVFVDTYTFDAGEQEFFYLLFWTGAGLSPLGGSGSNVGQGLVTELEVVPVATPTMKYWFFGSLVEGDGAEGDSKILQNNVLDITYDETNDLFYTIRFKEGGGSLASVGFDDDFTTISGTTQFNSVRWTESNLNTQFIRSIPNDNLVFSTSDGKGQLTTNYTVASHFNFSIDFDITTLTSPSSNFQIRAVDTQANVIGALGVGYSPHVPGDTYFSTFVKNIQNFTNSSNITSIRPNYETVTSGTETWAVVHQGADVWSVSGTTVGSISNAASGAIYESSYFSMFISTNNTPSIGESFSFDILSKEIGRGVSTGSLSLVRSAGAIATTPDVLGGSVFSSTDTVKAELFGKTTSSVMSMTADNFALAAGVGAFPTNPSFSIERVDSEGDVINPVIDTLDLLFSSTDVINDFINGQVGITNDGAKIYVKIYDRLVGFSFSLSEGTVTDGSPFLVPDTTAEIPVGGLSSVSRTVFNVNPATGEDLGGPESSLTYVFYESETGQLKINTVDLATLIDDTTDRHLIIEDSEIETTSSLTPNFFWNQNDFNTLYFIEDDGRLFQYNTDDRLVGFVNVNVEDPTLPAGTAAATDVIATVVSSWGVPLAGKTVNFAVVAGGGSISPSTATTSGTGEALNSGAFPQFTAGTVDGVSTIKVTVVQ